MTLRDMSFKELQKRVKKKGVPLYTTMDKELLSGFLSSDPWSLGWRFGYIKPQTMNRTDLSSAVEMLIAPTRDIGKIPKVQNFLKKHTVSTSMTTSPGRLPKLKAVLATLDTTYLDKIWIVLPERYGQKKERYKQKDINNIKKFSPLVHVLRTKKDYGPLTKMLPVLQKKRIRNQSLSQ